MLSLTTAFACISASTIQAQISIAILHNIRIADRSTRRHNAADGHKVTKVVPLFFYIFLNYLGGGQCFYIVRRGVMVNVF